MTKLTIKRLLKSDKIDPKKFAKNSRPFLGNAKNPFTRPGPHFFVPWSSREEGPETHQRFFWALPGDIWPWKKHFSSQKWIIRAFLLMLKIRLQLRIFILVLLQRFLHQFCIFFNVHFIKSTHFTREGRQNSRLCMFNVNFTEGPPFETISLGF